MLHVKPVRAALLEPDYHRIRDLTSALANEPERILPTIAFMKRTYPQRDALLELNLEVRQHARIIQDMARQGRVQCAAMMAQADQLLAALAQMKEVSCELRAVAQSRNAVVTFGKTIQVQGKISVMECLTKMLLFELEQEPV